jgi:hypothetical protein
MNHLVVKYIRLLYRLHLGATPATEEIYGHGQLGTHEQLALSDSKRLHPTLSSWLKNMNNKLSNLIDRLQELASAASSDYRSQLHRQIAALRTTLNKQQERYIEFLRLTEEYANRYLLDLSAEIRQQSSFLDMVEKRLDMAKTLHS